MFQVTGRYKTETRPTDRWIDSSIQADPNPQARAKLLEDDEYLANMREREPIYKFIIQNFVFDPNDFMSYGKYPILLMGYESAPLAAELSQWKYPVTLVVRNFFEAADAKKIMDRHNGVVNIVRGGVSGAKIIAWTGDDNMREQTKMDFIKYLSNRCNVLILSLPGLKIRERIKKEIKNSTEIRTFGGTPLIIIHP